VYHVPVTATQILDSAIAIATGFDAAPCAFDAYAEGGELRFRVGSPLHGAVIGLGAELRMEGFDEISAGAWSSVVVEAMNDAA